MNFFQLFYVALLLSAISACSVNPTEPVTHTYRNASVTVPPAHKYETIQLYEQFKTFDPPPPLENSKHPYALKPEKNLYQKKYSLSPSAPETHSNRVFSPRQNVMNPHTGDIYQDFGRGYVNPLNGKFYSKLSNGYIHTEQGLIRPHPLN